MITTGVGFFTFLLLVMAIVFTITNRYKKAKIFNIIPGLVWLMLIIAACATFGVFDLNSDGVVNAQNLMYSTFLPMMLIMFMLTCDIRHIIRLGPKMILGFFIATFSILIGLTVGFLVMKNHMPASAWGSFASVSGSWMGETVNMVAVASVFGVQGTDYVYAVLLDTVGFTIVSSVAFALVPHSKKWNEKMHATTDGLDEIAKTIENAESKRDNSAPQMYDYVILFAIALVGTCAINWLIPHLPDVTFLSNTGWRVVLSSVLGILLGLTKLHWLKGAGQVANVFLYLSLCVTMSYSDLSTCTQAPAFAVAAIIAVVVALIIWVITNRIFHIDLFTAEVGLMANYGGTSSAPIMAATFNPNWISFGILLGFFGDLVGTGLAIAFGNFLHYLSLL
jgi:uncharacterized membrane protein